MTGTPCYSKLLPRDMSLYCQCCLTETLPVTMTTTRITPVTLTTSQITFVIMTTARITLVTMPTTWITFITLTTTQPLPYLLLLRTDTQTV